ncbi:MAG TPA: hypothetical protein VNH40_12965 [Gaiellaceae bacterium]|nr:hypothetical protein [Gaiellaceae bacterium]
MGKQKETSAVEKKAHRFAVGGQIFAALSVLFLVPVIRKLRAQRHHKHRRHFPILGH